MIIRRFQPLDCHPAGAYQHQGPRRMIIRRSQHANCLSSEQVERVVRSEQETMTSRWRPDFDPSHLYFVTTTAVQHTKTFQRDIIKRILLDGLYYTAVVEHVKVYAFVIMPNHLHFVGQCPSDKPLGDMMRDYKANMARLIVRQYQAEQNYEVLEFLAQAVKRPGKQDFKVWDDGYNAKDVFSPEFLRQKIEYIHSNPLQPHWQMVERPEDYIWSSARFYLLNEPALIPLYDARELF
jgi:REP element-mobilizing transposase RayT